MSYNYKKLLPKIQAIIEKYGVELDVYRDTYESEVGVQTYKDTSLVATIKGQILVYNRNNNFINTQLMALYIMHIFKTQHIQ